MKIRLQRTKKQQEYRDNLAHDLENLRKHWDSWRELAEVLLSKKKYTLDYLDSFWNGRKLGKKMSKKWIEWFWRTVEKLSKNGEYIWDHAWTLASNLEKFEWLDHKEIAEKLIKCKYTFYDHESRYWDCVAENLEKFEWLDHKKIAEMLIKKGYLLCIAENLEKFEWLDHKEIVEKLIKSEYPWYITLYLEKFKLNHKEIVKKMIKNDCLRLVLKDIYKFKWLDKEIAKILIENWRWDVVMKYPEIFWLKKEK